MKVISNLYLKFTSIEFRVTLPKHHASIGGVERTIGSIKNTVSKSLDGPHQLIMVDKELLTWTHGVIEKLNNQPLILRALLGIPLTPNNVSSGLERVSEMRSTLQLPSTNRSTDGTSLSTCSMRYGSRNILGADSRSPGRTRATSLRLET